MIAATLTYTDILAGTANINTTLGIGDGKIVNITNIDGTGSLTLSGGTLTATGITTGAFNYSGGSLTYTKIDADSGDIDATLTIGSGKTVDITNIDGTGTLNLSTGGTLTATGITTGAFNYSGGSLTYTKIDADSADIDTALSIGTGKTVDITTITGDGSITLDDADR